MKRSLLLIPGILLSAALFSCKSKKVLVDRPPAQETVPDDRVKDLQDDLPGTQVEQVEEGVKVTFDSSILFELNSSYLTEEAHQQLQGLAAALKKHPYTSIRIDGHTDNTGTDEYNKWLSGRRAESVKSFLVEQGIPAGHMQTAGYGESRPVADNATPEGQARNRRVEVIINK